MDIQIGKASPIIGKYYLLNLLNKYIYTPIPILELHALHKQYTDYPTLASKYEVGSLYKNMLFIRNIQ